MKKYILKPEMMGGELFYMVYVRLFWVFDIFLERWNTLASAELRLKELKK